MALVYSDTKTEMELLIGPPEKGWAVVEKKNMSTMKKNVDFVILFPCFFEGMNWKLLF